MVDIISEAQRSWNMSRIKGKDTQPELLVRSLLHKLGYRFRIHRKDLPGKPDIILPRYKTVVFVHGCYWHRHKGCKYAYTPKSRVSFWAEKFKGNVERDKKHQKQLKEMGWTVHVIWECEVEKDIEKVRARLQQLLQ